MHCSIFYIWRFQANIKIFLWLGSLLENDQNFISRTCTGKFEFFTSRVSTVKIKNFISGVSKVKFRNFISRVSTRKFKIFISRVAKWKIHHVKIEQKRTNIFVRFFFRKTGDFATAWNVRHKKPFRLTPFGGLEFHELSDFCSRRPSRRYQSTTFGFGRVRVRDSESFERLSVFKLVALWIIHLIWLTK